MAIDNTLVIDTGTYRFSDFSFTVDNTGDAENTLDGGGVSASPGSLSSLSYTGFSINAAGAGSSTDGTLSYHVEATSPVAAISDIGLNFNVVVLPEGVTGDYEVYVIQRAYNDDGDLVGELRIDLNDLQDPAFEPADMPLDDVYQSLRIETEFVIDMGTTDGSVSISVFNQDYNGSDVAVIGDRVWLDDDRDGVQDGGEAGVAGVTVNLLDDAGNVVKTTTTDANGDYRFLVANPGDYQVEFIPPAGLEFTQRDQGGDDALDSDASLTTGRTPVFSVALGDENLTFDAGLVVTDTGDASIGDFVWFDADKDGIQDAGEAGIEGATVKLLNAAGMVLATTTTDANGAYLFDGLDAGDYKVMFVTKDGLVFTTSSGAADAAGNDSDADQSSGMTSLINLSIGEAERGVDAGMVDPGTASIGDYVWFDANRNGIQDAGETGVEGVEVKLLDAAGNVLGTTTTDAVGGYLFANLDAGSYKVMFGTKAGLIFTASSGAADAAGNDSDADETTGMTSVVELSIGEAERRVDAGLVLEDTGTASIGDFVWFDADKDGIQDAGEAGIEGATVKLLNAAGMVLATTTTDANGAYLFDGLDAGDYKVMFVTKDGLVFTTSSGAADAAGNNSDADQSNGMTSLINLSIGEAERGVDAGMVDPGTASIGDYVWFDANRNGIQDAGETGVEGVEVKLLDAAGNVLGTTTTNSLGGYLFENLDAGSYKVMFGTKDGLGFTTSAGAADAAGNDSDADQTTGMTSVVELSVGEAERQVDAGLVKLPGALSGTYFCDEDRDNVDDGAANGDLDIAGKTVMLFEADGVTPATDIDGDPVASVVTDANGDYRFDNLAEGDYVVKFEDSSNEGKDFVSKDQGGDDTVNSDVDQNTGKTDPVRVNAGEETTDVDAGVRKLDEISIDLEKLICETPDADFTPKTAPAGPEVIGQAGTLRMEQASRDGWVRVDFDAPIDDAVVVATVNTAEGSAPVVMRVRNVDSGGFEVQMQEWDYDDGAHVEEMISWMAVSRGVHTLANGQTISAGTEDLTDDWGRFDYNGAEFGADAPTVFAQVNNSGDGDVVTVRVDDVNNGGFAARLQSQQSYAARDQASAVDWIAVGRGVSADNGGLAAWTTGAQATEARQRFSIASADFEESPVILLQAQTANGADTAAVRGDGKNTDYVWLHVEEERSGDNEVRHAGENIGIMALSEGLLLSDGSWGVNPAEIAAAAAAAAEDDCHDADTEADAVHLAPGAEFTYKFEVTNNGAVDLTDIVLTDNNTTPGDASDDFAPEAVTSGGFNVGDLNQDDILNVGETWIYQAAGTAELGVHVNNAVVKGTSVSDDRMVTDEDPAVYVAVDPGTASIGNRVWLDSNKNGRQDAGESGVANVTVKLLDDSGNLLETTTTNNGGWYLFDDLNAGDYQVMFVKPGNYSFTVTDGGAADELGDDSDADRSTGMTSLVNLDIGENEDRVDAGLFQNGKQICAAVKASGGGNRTWSTEQWAEWISVKTDRPVSEDTTFTITLMNGSATYGQDMWFGTYGNRLDFTKGAQARSTTITIKEGQTIGHVADNKKLIIWQEQFGTENTESFSIKITKVQGNSLDTFKCLDSLEWDIYDTPTPVAFDLNRDGQIGVTGATTSFDKTGLEISDETVSFDINGDGEADQVEWLSGDGDAFLFDNRDGNAINDMDGSRLFGNADGHANGYEKLAELDVDGDGMLTGDELEGLQLWVDNGDAILTEDEILTLSEAGITAISTEMEIIESEDGRELMRSVAETEDGGTIMTEDVWFMHA